MDSKKFFCIRGYMKSGTNWICRLLNCHPDVDCIGEFHWESFYTALEQNVNRIAPARREMLASTVGPELEAMVKRCLVSMANENAQWIGDRTPTTLSPVVMSDAPHFVMIRDFRDVIVSRMFHLYNHPRVTSIFGNFPELDSRRLKFENDPWYFRDHPQELLVEENVVRDSAREWLAFLQSDQEIRERNPELPVLNVKYENLHKDFSKTVDSIFEFLQLERPAKIPAPLEPGHDLENPNKLNRKGQVGDWRTYFNDKSKGWVNQEIGNELIKLGYAESLDW